MKVLNYVFLFVLGFCKRIYCILPTLLLDPFDLAKKLLNKNYDVPDEFVWSVFAIGCIVALTLPRI